MRSDRRLCLTGLAGVSDALGRKDDLVVYLTRAIASCEETDRRRPAEGMATDLIATPDTRMGLLRTW